MYKVAVVVCKMPPAYWTNRNGLPASPHYQPMDRVFQPPSETNKVGFWFTWSPLWKAPYVSTHIWVWMFVSTCVSIFLSVLLDRWHLLVLDIFPPILPMAERCIFQMLWMHMWLSVWGYMCFYICPLFGDLLIAPGFWRVILKPASSPSPTVFLSLSYAGFSPRTNGL